jgi:sulfonate transport system substrate-binding protein
MKCFLLILLFSNTLWAAEPVKVRIGWQVPWALQGQLVQVLKHTDILKKNGLEAEFVGRNFGPELNELALGSQIDVILTADQPAAQLFSKDKGWVGVGRLMYNRTSTYVPTNSSLKTLADLKGKTVGVPFGAAAERIVVDGLSSTGIDTKSDVKLINLGIQEHAPLVIKSGKDATKWDQFDALSGFDPVPSILSSKGLVREIHVGKVCSMILMNNEFIKKHPDVAVAMVTSIRDAYFYYNKNRKQVDDWFMDEAKFDVNNVKALELASSLEPNVKAKNNKEIRMLFNDEDFLIMQKGADFIKKNTNKDIEMKNFVTNDYAKLVK